MASVAPLLLILTAVAVLGASGNLFSSSSWVIAVQVAALLIAVWARRSFQAGAFRVTAAPSGNSIIRNGPYRFVRHPMYSAALLFVWTAVLSHLSVLTFAIGVAATALALVRVRVEEQLLRATFLDYSDYSRSTKALIPFVF